jgi:hypothetical protein
MLKHSSKANGQRTSFKSVNVVMLLCAGERRVHTSTWAQLAIVYVRYPGLDRIRNVSSPYERVKSAKLEIELEPQWLPPLNGVFALS